jgi:hypothetical protein
MERPGGSVLITYLKPRLKVKQSPKNIVLWGDL